MESVRLIIVGTLLALLPLLQMTANPFQSLTSNETKSPAQIIAQASLRKERKDWRTHFFVPSRLSLAPIELQ
jgi:hypothetical protein